MKTFNIQINQWSKKTKIIAIASLLGFILLMFLIFSGSDSKKDLPFYTTVSAPFKEYLTVNGILESKQWVVTGDNKYEEVYENFEKSLQRLPKKDIDTFLRDRILSFIKSI